MVEDLVLRGKAMDWFSAHAPGVVDVSQYTGPVGGETKNGYVGRDDDGKVVAWVSFDALKRETRQPSAKPLLVLSYRQRFDRDTIERLSANMKPMRDKGWMCIVLDEQSRDGAQAFDVPLPTLDTLSTDSVIETLESLKRWREQRDGGGVRSMS